jgi:hypothetical protein
MHPAPKLPAVQADMQTVCQGGGGTVTSAARFFRDEQGRTRVEHGDIASIHDPVKGHSFVLNLPQKIAMQAPAQPPIPALPSMPSMPARPDLPTPQFKPPQMQETADLGEKLINGIRAQGKQFTMPAMPALPGMPKPPKPPVTEIWTAPDLKLPIQSTVTNPATGTTCVTEMKNIQPAKLEPAMFQVPPDFRIEPGYRK